MPGSPLPPPPPALHHLHQNSSAQQAPTILPPIIIDRRPSEAPALTSRPISSSPSHPTSSATPSAPLIATDAMDRDRPSSSSASYYRSASTGLPSAGSGSFYNGENSMFNPRDGTPATMSGMAGGDGPGYRPTTSGSGGGGPGDGSTSSYPPARTGAAPGARKQNVACDACRGRKVKCNRQPGEDTCEVCKSKGIECTSHYVTQINSSRKHRQQTKESHGIRGPGSRSPQGSDDSHDGRGMVVSVGGNGEQPSPLQGSAGFHGVVGHGHGHGHVGPSIGMGMGMMVGMGMGSSGGIKQRPSKRAKLSGHHGGQTISRLNLTAEIEQERLIGFLLSPTYVKDPMTFAYTDAQQNIIEQEAGADLGGGQPRCQVFFDPPSPATGELVSKEKRKELALDLIETFFQIVHIRQAIIHPSRFRKCFSNPSGDAGPVSHAQIACVMAFGAKFSEHPIIVEDRDYCSSGLPTGKKRSRIAQMLASRAQQVMETEKIWRKPTMENLQTLCLMAALVGGNVRSPTTYRPFWEGIQTSHVRALGYNKSSVMQGIASSSDRFLAGQIFWSSVWADSFAAVLYRSQPSLREEDYDVDPMHTWVEHEDVVTKMTMSTYLTWHNAMSTMAKICRTFAAHVWTPRCESFGVPLNSLKLLTGMMGQWREGQLSKVGVPSAWPESWDFLAASTACTIDCHFHALWVVMAWAVDNYGVKELRVINDGPDFASVQSEGRMMVDKIHREALNGALRISALAGVLHSNNYLRLDPNHLFHAIWEGGRYLAEKGRSEVDNCIKGLQQNAMAFEDAFERAEELDETYKTFTANGSFPQFPTSSGMRPPAVAPPGYPAHAVPQLPPHMGSQDFSYDTGNQHASSSAFDSMYPPAGANDNGGMYSGGY